MVPPPLSPGLPIPLTATVTPSIEPAPTSTPEARWLRLYLWWSTRWTKGYEESDLSATRKEEGWNGSSGHLGKMLSWGGYIPGSVCIVCQSSVGWVIAAYYGELLMKDLQIRLHSVLVLAWECEGEKALIEGQRRASNVGDIAVLSNGELRVMGNGWTRGCDVHSLRTFVAWRRIVRIPSSRNGRNLWLDGTSDCW